jgi:hypothetical protein
LHLNWLAVEGGERADVLERLGFYEGEAADNWMGVSYACASLPNGWHVIVSSDYSLDLDRLLPAASAGRTALGAEVSEIAMSSRLRAFDNGRFAWSVAHDGEAGADGFETRGEPPAVLTEIRARLEAEQAAAAGEAVDFIFEIPGELARSICGFSLEQPDCEWTVLREGPAPRPRPPRARRRAATGSRSLRAAVRSDLWPLLQSLGWEAVDWPDWPKRVFGVRGVRDGRLQVLWFDDMDDGAYIYLVPYFVVFAGEGRQSDPLIRGRIGTPRAPFRTRVARRFRTVFGPTLPVLTRDERLAAVVERARSEILVADRFLANGDWEPCVLLDVGAPEILRSLAPPG